VGERVSEGRVRGKPWFRGSTREALLGRILTLTLSHGEREQPASDSVFQQVRGADTSLGVLKASGGFSLSPRERAGVRGKVTLAVRTALALAGSLLIARRAEWL